MVIRIMLHSEMISQAANVKGARLANLNQASIILGIAMFSQVFLEFVSSLKRPRCSTAPVHGAGYLKDLGMDVLNVPFEP